MIMANASHVLRPTPRSANDVADNITESFGSLNLLESDAVEEELEEMMLDSSAIKSFVRMNVSIYYPVFDENAEIHRTQVTPPYRFLEYAERAGLADIVCLPTPMSSGDHRHLIADLKKFLPNRSRCPALMVHNDAPSTPIYKNQISDIMIECKDFGLAHLFVHDGSEDRTLFESIVSNLAIEFDDLCADLGYPKTCIISRLSVTAVIQAAISVMFDLPGNSLECVSLLIDARHAHVTRDYIDQEVPGYRQAAIYKRVRQLIVDDNKVTMISAL